MLETCPPPPLPPTHTSQIHPRLYMYTLLCSWTYPCIILIPTDQYICNNDVHVLNLFCRASGSISVYLPRLTFVHNFFMCWSDDMLFCCLIFRFTNCRFRCQTCRGEQTRYITINTSGPESQCISRQGQGKQWCLRARQITGFLSNQSLSDLLLTVQRRHF